MAGHADCERRGPDPECYGCLGTGTIKWANVPKDTTCWCVYWCDVHDDRCFAPWHDRTEQEMEGA